MCPGIVPIVENKDVGACPALQGLGEQYVYAWSAYPSTDKCAIMVDLLNGKAEGCTRASLYHPVTRAYRALCE